MKKLGIVMLFLVLAMGMIAVTETGAEAAETQEELDNGTWKIVRNRVRYFDSSDTMVTGLVTIKGKKYYFGPKGAQRVGWWKIDDKYYFFNRSTKSGAYMVTGKKVNMIDLDKNGVANLNANWKKKKAWVLGECSRIVHKITNCKMTVLQKMKKAYDYERAHYSIGGSQVFHAAKHHDVNYAYNMQKKKKGVCFGWGALYAYLANACGGKKCAFISSGGHGWAEVNGRVSDPDWEFADKAKSYFNFSYEESGHGRPKYKQCRSSVKWV